jgi:hypothetical protein
MATDKLVSRQRESITGYVGRPGRRIIAVAVIGLVFVAGCGDDKKPSESSPVNSSASHQQQNGATTEIDDGKGGAQSPEFKVLKQGSRD